MKNGTLAKKAAVPALQVDESLSLEEKIARRAYECGISTVGSTAQTWPTGFKRNAK